MKENITYDNEVEIFDRIFDFETKLGKEVEKNTEAAEDEMGLYRSSLKGFLYKNFRQEYIRRQKKLTDDRKSIFLKSQKIFPLFIYEADKICLKIEETAREHIHRFFDEIEMEDKQTEFIPTKKTYNGRKTRRPRFTEMQRISLKEIFDTSPYPGRQEKVRLGQRLGLTYQQIEDWFSNQRTRQLKRSAISWVE